MTNINALPPHKLARRLRGCLARLPGADQDALCVLFVLIFPELSGEQALKENPVEHHLFVTENVIRIAGAEQLNLRQEAAAGLLHDIAPVGKISKTQLKELKKTFDNETNPERKLQYERDLQLLDDLQYGFRTLHMRKGSAIANERLLEVNQALGRAAFDRHDVEQVCDLISIHDSPSILRAIPGDNRAAVCFREADRLWMVSEEGVLADLRREAAEVSEDAKLDRAKKNQIRYKEEKRDCYAGDPTCINDTFFRTQTGYEVYKGWCDFWGINP